jgi:hypothetical protein
VLPVRYELGLISLKMGFFIVTAVKMSNLATENVTKYVSYGVIIPIIILL